MQAVTVGHFCSHFGQMQVILAGRQVLNGDYPITWFHTYGRIDVSGSLSMIHWALLPGHRGTPELVHWSDAKLWVLVFLLAAFNQRSVLGDAYAK